MMPERMLYDEAMRFAKVRIKAELFDLKQGQVETATLATVNGPLELPWGIDGGFSVVYKFRKQSGEYCALRCFRVPMPPDMQFRYERMSSYFAAHIPDITISFKYYEQGILIKEFWSGVSQSKIYPLIVMDWVEGAPLLETIDTLCKKREKRGIRGLADHLLTLFMALQRNQVAHGDLSGSDIIVKPDGHLILIDYDGVYIPDFSDLRPIVAGKSDYQHPEMFHRKFNEHMDDFSALIIYIALRVLAIQPDLWDKYAYSNPQGRLMSTNLLFKSEDFRNPNQSVLIHELQSIDDIWVQLAVKELKKACHQSIDQVRFPFHIIDPLGNNF